MKDLNDLFFYAEVVAHGGFAPAGRALRQPKSKLSRRVAQLEARLGVRLIERSSRRFRVTEIGQAFYERCRAILDGVEEAEAVIAEAKSEPHGTVRLSCPAGLMEVVAGVLPGFMVRYPKVKVLALVTNRRVDLIAERIDVALRVRDSLDTDAALTMRTLAKSRRILVAGPALAQRLSGMTDVAELAAAPTLSMSDEGGDVLWPLIGPSGEIREVHHQPLLGINDFAALREAAAANLGVTLLPMESCWPMLQNGRLIRLFPAWHARDGIVHLVFTTHRGLPPAVRALIDYLAENFRNPDLFPALD